VRGAPARRRVTIAPVWTTCPLCRGSGFLAVTSTGPDGAPLHYEDDCPRCQGDGGVAAWDDEDDPAALDDVDVKDED